MDSIMIKQLVDKQLETIGITDGKIYILEKDFGYIVQVIYEDEREDKYLNEVIDKHGNIVYSLGNFANGSGEIYKTEVFERMEKKGKTLLAREPAIRYKELDENHFILPRLSGKEIRNALFFIDKDNHVTYKGIIPGKISGTIISENKKLLESKQVVTNIRVDIEEARSEQDEHFFYSWDKNCRTSDKWSRLLGGSASELNVRDVLYNQIGLPTELIEEIIKYMQSNEVYLATLNLNSQDNEHHMNCMCLIGLDGIPLIDLTYITKTYEVQTIPLKKQRIGEVDTIKKLLQDRIDRKVTQINNNKKNISANFFKTVGLGMNDSKYLNDTSMIEEEFKE